MSASIISLLSESPDADSSGHRRRQPGQVGHQLGGGDLLAEELLRGEGFTDVQYVKVPQAQNLKSSLAGDIDLSADSAPAIIIELDAGHMAMISRPRELGEVLSGI